MKSLFIGSVVFLISFFDLFSQETGLYNTTLDFNGEQLPATVFVPED